MSDATTSNASVDEFIELDHHCSECGTTSAADVEGLAGGSDVAFAGSQSEARNRAREDLARNAVLMISLARCPRCGKRDRVALRSFALRQSVSATLLAACGGLLGYSFGWPFLIGGGILGMSAGYKRYSSALEASDRQVVWRPTAGKIQRDHE
jgi:hypothetical protein